MKTSVDETLTVLTLRTLIPTMLEITPASVSWSPGATPIPHMVELNVGIEEPVHVIGASTDNSSFFADIIEVIPGQQYHLKLTPKSTDTPCFTRIGILTDSPPEAPRVFYIQAHVKGAKNENSSRATIRWLDN